MFSDEVRVSIFGSDGVRYIQRRVGYQTVLTMKHTVSMMVYASNLIAAFRGRCCRLACIAHCLNLSQLQAHTRAAHLPVGGPMLAEVSERLAKEMGLSEWKCSNGFLKLFLEQGDQRYAEQYSVVIRHLVTITCTYTLRHFLAN